MEIKTSLLVRPFVLIFHCNTIQQTPQAQINVLGLCDLFCNITLPGGHSHTHHPSMCCMNHRVYNKYIIYGHSRMSPSSPSCHVQSVRKWSWKTYFLTCVPRLNPVIPSLRFELQCWDSQIKTKQSIKRNI